MLKAVIVDSLTGGPVLEVHRVGSEADLPESQGRFGLESPGGGHAVLHDLPYFTPASSVSARGAPLRLPAAGTG